MRMQILDSLDMLLVIGILVVGNFYVSIRCGCFAAVYHEKGLLTTASLPIPVLPTSMLLYTGPYPCKKKMIIMINLFSLFLHIYITYDHIDPKYFWDNSGNPNSCGWRHLYMYSLGCGLPRKRPPYDGISETAYSWKHAHSRSPNLHAPLYFYYDL